jgi:hypothetical protein
MRLAAFVCAVAGHRWGQPADVQEAYPLLECSRCGRRMEVAPGTTPAGFGARLDAKTGADRSVGPFGGRR